ncbi:hypothetical protein [Methylobacterium fujisawaense]|uniref:hypothetical protein n=1 Tax=Methylobacterium fujisawaense TaxID=107400 RepID=UPI002F35FFCF
MARRSGHGSSRRDATGVWPWNTAWSGPGASERASRRICTPRTKAQGAGAMSTPSASEPSRQISSAPPPVRKQLGALPS